MPSIRPMLWGLLLIAAGGSAHAAPDEAPAAMTLSPTARIYVTLAPRTAESDEYGWHRTDIASPSRPPLGLSLGSVRRNRLEFALTHTDVVARGDRLRLRLASDAHVIAQLLSGGQFSEEGDSWIAVLGLASRLRLSYEFGPWELSVSARRKFGAGNVRAHFGYALRF